MIKDSENSTSASPFPDSYFLQFVFILLHVEHVLCVSRSKFHSPRRHKIEEMRKIYGETCDLKSGVCMVCHIY